MQRKRSWRNTSLAARRARVTARSPRGGTQLATQTLALMDSLGLTPTDGAVALYEAYASEPETRDLETALTDLGWSVLLPDLEFPMDSPRPFVDRSDGNYVCSVASEGPPAVALVILPGLAFGTDGRRLGRGAGWYDRALALLHRDQDSQPVLVGFCFDTEVHGPGSVPTEKHDMPVDYVVTPTRTVRSPNAHHGTSPQPLTKRQPPARPISNIEACTFERK